MNRWPGFMKQAFLDVVGEPPRCKAFARDYIRAKVEQQVGYVVGGHEITTVARRLGWTSRKFGGDVVLYPPPLDAGLPAAP